MNPTIAASAIANATFGILEPVHELVSVIQELDPELDISDRLITITFEDIENEGETITDIMAICLQDAPLLTSHRFLTDDLYLTRVINSDNLFETAKALWLMLYEGDRYEQ